MILMYHKVDVASPTMWWVDVASFYRQMLELQDRHVVHLDDYDSSDACQVVITFDGVYQNVLTYAAPIMKELSYPFELFISSDLIGAMNEFDLGEPPAPFADEDDLKGLIAMGGRLQWHSRSHPRMNQLSTVPHWNRMMRELDIPRDVEALDPRGLRWFAYPYGEFSSDVRELVSQKFSGAVSCDQGDDLDRYALNRLTVTNATSFRRHSICVIVVSYNYGEFLVEAIESVLHQTWMPDSVLIMDDASTDSTKEIGEKYQALNPELIKYCRNSRRRGIVDTFNLAVRETDSDYVCFLGADNRFPSNYLQNVMAEFHKGDPGAAIVYTDFLLFGSRAQEEYLRHPAERRGRIVDGIFYEVCFPEFSRNAFMRGSFIHGSSAYLRSAFDDVGGYQLHEHRPEDANLFKRMIKAGYTARKASGTWLEYRQHSEEQANAASRASAQLEFHRLYAKRLELKIRVLERAFGFLSPIIRLASVAEKLFFEGALRIAKWWRRRS